MNNTFVIMIAALGGLLWVYAVFRERYKSTTGGSVFTLLKKFFAAKLSEPAAVTETEVPDKLTIDFLEQELGIEPDHYLCDRIARINEALVARRDKRGTKKKGGAS